MTTVHPAEAYTVVDADAHYHTEFGNLAEYIDDDDPWKYRFQDGHRWEHRSDNNHDFWPKVSGMAHANATVQDAFETIEGAPNRLGDTADVIATMEELRIDVSLLLSNKMLAFSLMTLEDRRQAVFANAYAEYMLAEVVDPAENVYMSLPVPYKQPGEAAALIHRVGGEPGIAGVCFVSCEPPMGHRKYDPIYDAAQDEGLPVVFHSGLAYGDQFPLDGYSTYLETHSLAFVWENMAQLTSMLTQGVPVKFPDLDFVFQEAGIFWIPQIMYRLDTEYFRNEDHAPLLDRRPSAYMKEFYFCTQPIEVTPTPTYYEYVMEMIGGPERLMYASDYPHPDFDDPRVIAEMGFLSEAQKARILGGNALEVFDV